LLDYLQARLQFHHNTQNVYRESKRKISGETPENNFFFTETKRRNICLNRGEMLLWQNIATYITTICGFPKS